jgi:branched-subunit amino acid transport protein
MNATVWLAVGVIGAATIGLKTAGPVLLGGRRLPPLFQRTVIYLTPAVLAALVMVQSFASGQRLVLDARAAGLVAAAIALLLRAPVLLVVIIATVTAALIRALA